MSVQNGSSSNFLNIFFDAIKETGTEEGWACEMIQNEIDFVRVFVF